VWLRFGVDTTFYRRVIRQQGATVIDSAHGGPAIVRVTQFVPDRLVSTYLMAYSRGVPLDGTGRQPTYQMIAPAWVERAVDDADRFMSTEPNATFRTYFGHYVAIGWPVRVLWVGLEQDGDATLLRTVPRQGVDREAVGPGRFASIADVWPLGIIWVGQIYWAGIWFGIVGAVTLGPRIALAMRWHWRAKRGRCGACGYQLQGSVSGVCPECGANSGAQSAKCETERGA